MNENRTPLANYKMLTPLGKNYSPKKKVNHSKGYPLAKTHIYIENIITTHNNNYGSLSGGSGKESTKSGVSFIIEKRSSGIFKLGLKLTFVPIFPFA